MYFFSFDFKTLLHVFAPTIFSVLFGRPEPMCEHERKRAWRLFSRALQPGGKGLIYTY